MTPGTCSYMFLVWTDVSYVDELRFHKYVNAGNN